MFILNEPILSFYSTHTHTSSTGWWWQRGGGRGGGGGFKNGMAEVIYSGQTLSWNGRKHLKSPAPRFIRLRTDLNPFPENWVMAEWAVSLFLYSHWNSPDAMATYLLTYLLTPWCRVLLQKLTGLQLVKKFPAFHGTRSFITALTSVCHVSLSWARPIQSITHIPPPGDPS